MEKTLPSEKRNLLLVDDRGIRIFSRRDLNVVPTIFPCNEEGLAQLAAWLKARRGGVFEIVSNLSGDEFQVETLPPALSGRDRRAVLQRLQTRNFEGRPYVLSLTLGTRGGARPGEQVLFAALPAPFLGTLIETLTVHGGALAGLYGFALLLGEASRSADGTNGANSPLPEALLLVTRHLGVVRETFLLRGQTVFSRMASPPGWEAGILHPWLVEEAESLSRYLMTQGLLARETPLTVCSFSGSWRMDADDPEGRRFITPPAPHLTEADAETALLGWLARHVPKTQFAPPALRLARFAPWFQWGAMALGGIVFVAGIGFGVHDWRRAEVLQPVIAETRQRIEVLEAQPLPVEDSGLRLESEALSAFFEQVDALRREAAQDCLELALPAQVLDAQPAARLDRLHWRCDEARTMIVMTGHFPDHTALETFGDWLANWRPSGWRVTLPEEVSEANTGLNVVERSGDLPQMERPIFHLRLERGMMETKTP